MNQKHINVIKTCLKMATVLGNEKCKKDIEETLNVIDDALEFGDIKLENHCRECYNYNIGDGVDDITKCKGCEYRS